MEKLKVKVISPVIGNIWLTELISCLDLLLKLCIDFFGELHVANVSMFSDRKEPFLKVDELGLFLITDFLQDVLNKQLRNNLQPKIFHSRLIKTKLKDKLNDNATTHRDNRSGAITFAKKSGLDYRVRIICCLNINNTISLTKKTSRPSGSITGSVRNDCSQEQAREVITTGHLATS